MKTSMRALILIAIFAAGTVAGFAINGWRLREQIAQIERDQAIAAEVASETAKIKERSWNTQLQEARNAATKRETILRRDAGRARDAASGLRVDLAELRRQLPDLAADAVRRYGDTVGVILGECAAKYQGLAEQADRIDSDRKTLVDAWPKP